MGMLHGPCCPRTSPTTSRSAPSTERLAVVRGIYAEGIATGNATFETEIPDRRDLEAAPGSRPPLGRRGRRPGGGLDRAEAVPAGTATPASPRLGLRRRGRPRPRRGKALIHRRSPRPTTAGLWTLQTSIFPENRASLALHHSAGYRTLAVRNVSPSTAASGGTRSSSNAAAPSIPTSEGKSS